MGNFGSLDAAKALESAESFVSGAYDTLSYRLRDLNIAIEECAVAGNDNSELIAVRVTIDEIIGKLAGISEELVVHMDTLFNLEENL